MELSNTFWVAIGLSALAGLSTTIGSVIGIFYKEPGPKYMAFTLGFSAGVMVLVSFMELLASAVVMIGFSTAYVAFFIGILVMFAIDVALPHSYILEDHHEDKFMRTGKREDKALMRTSMLVAFGIAIHNFPEGMVTFAGAMQNIDLGIALAFAVAIHNIPEGIAVAVPVYAATKSSKKAFGWSFLSGLSEPVGALLAGLVLMPFLNDSVLGWMLALVAGFMVFISLDELLPVAHSYKEEHVAILGVIAGMMVMALSLVLLV
ncbi:MAG: zinc transporter ZupT [Deltaproteobacteria bacterium]|nr:zinc transporter ZupT [Deltaproteobacteria bacterium]